jgi:hypothetical protein
MPHTLEYEQVYSLNSPALLGLKRVIMIKDYMRSAQTYF